LAVSVVSFFFSRTCLWLNQKKYKKACQPFYNISSTLLPSILCPEISVSYTEIVRGDFLKGFRLQVTKEMTKEMLSERG